MPILSQTSSSSRNSTQFEQMNQMLESKFVRRIYRIKYQFKNNSLIALLQYWVNEMGFLLTVQPCFRIEIEIRFVSRICNQYQIRCCLPLCAKAIKLNGLALFQVCPELEQFQLVVKLKRVALIGCIQRIHSFSGQIQ
ncbi:Hypothetical_protein [Hexamita inflata]|uniref:Hypothetical_protein n=1 Tax=Hexamita inflata TaxID=28002 RepID=A0ABP1HZ09_9EUKA